jgi:O-antigen/teichoic acid export membrane protein
MTRNFLHLGLGQAATTILTILLSALLARTLSGPDFGMLYLLMSIATFTFVVAEWGQGAILIREAAQHPERTGDLLGSTLVSRLAFAVVGSVCAFLGTWLLGYDWHTRVLAALLILCWVPQYLAFSFGWAFRACERMDRDAQLNVTLKLATLLGSSICLMLGGRVLGLLLTWSLAGSISLAMALFMYRRLRLPGIVATARTLWELTRDGAPLVVMGLTIFLEPLLNTNILFGLTSPTVVGWYGAGWTIAGTLLAPATVLSSAMYPRLSMALGNKEEFKRTFSMSLRPIMLLAVLGAVGTYLFADVPVAIIYGVEKFAPAADTLRAFAPVLLLMYLDMFLGLAAVVAGKTARLAVTKIVAVALTAGLSYALIPICETRYGNGGLGVLFAMTIGEFWMFAINALMITEVFDRRTVGNMCRFVVAGAATILLFKLLPAFTPFLGIPLCVAVFGGLTLLVGAVKVSDIGATLASFRRAATPAQESAGAQ